MRRKAKLLVLFIIILLGIGCYIFRYPLVLAFQYSRIKSLGCSEQVTNNRYNCLQKIWVHRVNSLERYDLLKDKFEGFELDLEFRPERGIFLVNHPTMMGEGDTLQLDTYLRHADLQHHSLWFDTRFVAYINMNEALAAVSRLPDTAMIKQKCVFEIYDAQAAALFARHGYTTSFNVYEALHQRLQNNQSFRDSINNELTGVRYISQEAAYVPALEKIFPDKKIVTWELHFSSFFNRGELKTLLKDPQIAILLVNIQTPYYR